MGRKRRHFTVMDIAEMGMMLALIETGKRALDFLPNIEVVTLLFIVFTLSYGLKTIVVAVSFTFFETAVYGFNNWVIMYLYMWPLLIVIVYATRRHAGLWFYSILSGLYGLFFGLLCSIPYLVVGGPTLAFTWWIAGIPYDIIHCVGNFALCLALYKPLTFAMNKVQALFDRRQSAGRGTAGRCSE